MRGQFIGEETDDIYDQNYKSILIFDLNKNQLSPFIIARTLNHL